MSKLYELSEQFYQLANELEEANLDEQIMLDTLNGSTEMMNLEEKTTGIIKMVKNWQGDIPAYDAEIKRLTKERDTLKNRINYIKEYLKHCLEIAKLNKVKIGTLSVRIQKNGKGSTIIVDKDLVPAAYLDIVPKHTEISKERLYEDLKTGKEIPGVKYEVGKHIVIS
jgi:hypothetical protein